uniref:Putative secreted protein n=1 Tax=Amblyomma triste TaxID=251400 RepID=A0A023GAI8_AMBTT
MIFTFAILFCMQAAAANVLRPGNFLNDTPILDIRSLTQVTGPLVVVNRTHHIESEYRCLTAEMVQNLSVTQYAYELRAGKYNGTSFVYGTEKVTVNLTEVKNRTGVYEASYYSSKTNLTANLTLEMKDTTNSCFVIWVRNSDYESGCELLVKDSQLEHIPQGCKDYYEENCTAPSLQLHNSSCIYEPFTPLQC